MEIRQVLKSSASMYPNLFYKVSDETRRMERGGERRREERREEERKTSARKRGVRRRVATIHRWTLQRAEKSPRTT